MKTAIIAIMIMGMMGTPVFAGSGNSDSGAAAAASVQSGDVQLKGAPVSVKGVMELTESGLFLLDGKDTFLLRGDKALERLIGQPVEVKGLLAKDEKQAVIFVTEVKVVN